MITATNEISDDISDVTLSQRMATGDTAALELLMRRYNQSLYRAARSILKDDNEAEEAVQDAYLKAYRNIGSYRSDAKLSTWLTRIAINEALTRVRKRNRRAEILYLDGAVPQAEEDTVMQQNTAYAPEHAVLRTEVRHLIEQKIDSLPDTFRCVFVLRALEDLTVEETAACLNIPEATVRTRHFRARGLLREALAREIDFNLENAFGFAGSRCDRIVANVLERLESPPNT
ncbi:MAG: RNA polymerase sigma factor [Porticoccus sp.]|nr:RNA polymerase sigma factor [Porticoccus sp.]